jgi:hypothetical protein
MTLCDHKFVDSKNCLKCGWSPDSRDAMPKPTPQEAEVTREQAWGEYREDFSAVGPTQYAFDRGWDAGRASRDAELERARGELLDELESAMVAHYEGGCGEGLAFRCALGDMRTKYTRPTQPSLETE